MSSVSPVAILHVLMYIMMSRSFSVTAFSTQIETLTASILKGGNYTCAWIGPGTIGDGFARFTPAGAMLYDATLGSMAYGTTLPLPRSALTGMSLDTLDAMQVGAWF